MGSCSLGWFTPAILSNVVFFDDDGTVYYTRHGGGRNGGVYQARVDLKAGKLLDEPRLV